jgi:hypothetical protein
VTFRGFKVEGLELLRYLYLKVKVLPGMPPARGPEAEGALGLKLGRKSCTFKKSLLPALSF